MNVSDNILLKNFQARKANHSTGDFNRINGLALKETILDEIKQLKFDKDLIYFNILKNNDYEKEYKKLIDIIKKKINFN